MHGPPSSPTPIPGCAPRWPAIRYGAAPYEPDHRDLAAVTPGPEAPALSARTGKPAEVVQLTLDESTEH
ncbi:hypothetical protein AB0O07_13945 [Streptomyces sp. NPDC093085]|uniref:hypothetical protein n=1 Tax=Streptomyces sp. NPDC093085 TaxID=3155068 RepID=UPI00341AC2B5